MRSYFALSCSVSTLRSLDQLVRRNVSSWDQIGRQLLYPLGKGFQGICKCESATLILHFLHRRSHQRQPTAQLPPIRNGVLREHAAVVASFRFPSGAPEYPAVNAAPSPSPHRWRLARAPAARHRSTAAAARQARRLPRLPLHGVPEHWVTRVFDEMPQGPFTKRSTATRAIRADAPVNKAMVSHQ